MSQDGTMRKRDVRTKEESTGLDADIQTADCHAAVDAFHAAAPDLQQGRKASPTRQPPSRMRAAWTVADRGRL
jgi:hypothetical protein